MWPSSHYTSFPLNRYCNNGCSHGLKECYLRALSNLLCIGKREAQLGNMQYQIKIMLSSKCHRVIAFLPISLDEADMTFMSTLILLKWFLEIVLTECMRDIYLIRWELNS